MVRTRGLLVVLLLAIAVAASLDHRLAGQGAVTLGGPLPGPLPLLPADNWWNADISQAPVDDASAGFIDYIQAFGRRRLHPDMGGSDGEGGIYGMPYIVVPGSQPLEPVTFVAYGDESDSGAPGRPPGYPIPLAARTTPGWIEGGAPGGGTQGDRHLLIVDRDNRFLFELWATRWNASAGRWEAGSGAVFPLDTNLRRPDGWTSADAAGLAILPGLIRYDEVYGPDPIRHAFRVTVRATNGHVFPASHTAGSTTAALPMGARLRLKASTDLSAFPAPLRKIFQAMQTYGLIVADNGSDMFIQGTNDARWDMDVMLPAFRSLHADDFEVIELGWTPEIVDEDGDALPDAWEVRFGLDPTETGGDNGADGDPDGDGLTNAQEHERDSHPRGFRVRYFAEGLTSSQFSTRVALLNPGDAPASVLLRFLPPTGEVVTHHVAVGPRRRATVDAATVAGLGATAFSTIVESDALIVADRTMTWTGQGAGSHAESGLVEPSLVWYLAEGATVGPFQLFYLLQNPGPLDAAVRVTYLRPVPRPPVERTYRVPAESRVTIWVDEEASDLASTDVAARIESTNGVPIIVERAMYMNAGGVTFRAGHNSAGILSPDVNWFLAEGATGDYFDMFVLIANPNTSAAAVTARFLRSDGAVVTRTYTVAARSRFNIWVDFADPLLADAAVSVEVTSTNNVPIIVERAMWWPGSSATWFESHNSPGATEAGPSWALADGEVGGARDTETYLLVANTSSVAASVRVTLLFEGGAPVSKTFSVMPSSRFSVDVGAEFPEAAGRRFGAVVESLGSPATPIVVERAMYWNVNGVGWSAGIDSLATPLP